MKKKVSYFIVFTVIVIIAVQQMTASATSITKAFGTSGANFVSGELYVYGIKIPMDANKASLKKVAKILEKYTGEISPKTYKETWENNDYISMFKIDGVSKNGQEIEIVSKKQNAGGKSGIYLSCSIVWEDSNYQAEKNLQSVSEGFRALGMEPHSSIEMTGNYQGKLSTEKMNETASSIFSSVHAKKVEGMRDNKLVSVSAWSPNIGNDANVNGRKVNFNIALRYNEMEDKTYIWMGNPIIKTEY